MFDYNRNANRTKRYSYNNYNQNHNNNNSNNIPPQMTISSEEIEINEENYRSEIVSIFESISSPRKFHQQQLERMNCSGIELAHDAIILDRKRMTDSHVKKLYKNEGLIVGEYFAFIAPMVIFF